MTQSDGITEIIQCNTANEFIKILRASDQLWLSNEARETKWLFRGQGNADWSVIPSAWRMFGWVQDWRNAFNQKIDNPIREAILTTRSGYHASQSDVDRFELYAEKNPYLKDVLLQSMFEIDLVRRFVEFVDQLGMPIPQNKVVRMDSGGIFDWRMILSEAASTYHRSAVASKDARVTFPMHYCIWPYKNSPIVALARHHGLPSSLIDWTKRPVIAAFFAAEDVVVNNFEAQNICVWAIHSNVIDGLGQRLKRLHLYRSELGYLHAQDGVLTYDIDADNFYLAHGKWPTIVDIVQDTKHDLTHSPLRKILLPATQAEEVLRLLWAEGISRPHLMPSFDTVSQTLKQHWHRL